LVHIDVNVQRILPVVTAKHFHLTLIRVPHHRVTITPNVSRIATSITRVNVVLVYSRISIDNR
uniref:Secreted protein n=1 Tax=Elaeophora elaphi TaxID=1147741 RepID=A0A0R3RHI4_9BILA